MDAPIGELLGRVTVVQLLGALALIGGVIALLVSQNKRISGALNKWRKNKNDKESFTKMVYDLRDSVESLKDSMETFKGNRVSDRETSRKIQGDIYEAIAIQARSITELKEIVLEMQAKNAKTKRAELKRSIESIYSECHPHQACTEMAYETLKDLIEEYEENGGKNSFVHTIVEPEMVSWRRVQSVSDIESESAN